ncbi:AAA family ATPase [Planctomycetales bacterium ZRK34]|nr:AAA family ATPase [Planctomycetales bacterium ZRK34]
MSKPWIGTGMVAEQTTVIPPGYHEAKIVASQMNDTTDGNRLDLNFEIVGGAHDGCTVTKQLHLNSRNANTLWRDRHDLARICAAVGIMAPHDSSELHNIPVLIEVGVNKRRNTILSYGRSPSAKNNPPSKQRRLTLTRADRIEMRPPDWLLRGMLERDTLALVFGDPGTGKSFLAIDWAARVATGTPWRGQAVKAGPVVYLAGEGRQGFGRRTRAWEQHHGVSLAEAPLYVGPAVAIADPTELVDLIDAIDEGEAPALIVLDTLARCFGGGDENSTQDMSKFVSACDALRRRYGCTILVIHHTGHADKSRARGAIALKAALDAEYRLSDNDAGLILTATKMKDAETPTPLSLEMVSVELPDLVDDYGNPVTSAAVEVTDADTGALESQARTVATRRSKWQRIGLEIARRLMAIGDDGQASVKDWHTECNAAGMRQSTRYDVLAKLQERGDLVVDSESIVPP